MAFTILYTIPATITLGPAPLGSLETFPPAVGGAPIGNIEYIVTAGSLPHGLNLDLFTGVISGNPIKVEAFSFTVTARDDGGAIAIDSPAGDTAPDPMITPIFVNPTLPVQAYEFFPYGPFIWKLYTYTTFNPANFVQTAGLPFNDVFSDDGFGTITITSTRGSGFPTGITVNCYEYLDTFGNMGATCFDVDGLSGDQSSGRIVATRLVDPVSGGPSFDIELTSSALYSGVPGGIQITGSWLHLEQ